MSAVPLSGLYAQSDDGTICFLAHDLTLTLVCPPAHGETVAVVIELPPQAVQALLAFVDRAGLVRLLVPPADDGPAQPARPTGAASVRAVP